MSFVDNKPPRLFLRFFRWYCHQKLRDYIEGDLMEVYQENIRSLGKQKADRKFIIDVLLLFRPDIVRSFRINTNANAYSMYKSYFKISWRNIAKDKGYSFINIGGLALGMAFAMLIGLWAYDELSFNKHNEHYSRIAIVLQNNTVDGTIETTTSQSFQLGSELRNSYGNYFKHVVMSSFPVNSILSDSEKAFTLKGTFMEADGPELLSLKMLYGTHSALQDPTSVLLCASAAKNFFGDADPVGMILRLDNGIDLKVTGVYQDLPDNSDFKGELSFIAPLDIIIKSGNRNLGWVNNWLQVFVQVGENVDMHQASDAIKDTKIKKVDEYGLRYKPELFLHPMNRWHLYSGFSNGVNTGGRIEFVWLFGAIGIFVMLLACINFMNLSTARSQKRAKEVGVRKVVGSARSQLIGQFLSESLLVVALSFIFSLALVQLFLPWFNEVADKNINLLSVKPSMWLLMTAVVFLIALISGSYPAFYLSAFRPIKVLKGTFRVGRYATIPRKALVVVQFTVSVTLIIGTIIVYQQIEFAKKRPIGYEMSGLITIPMKTREVKNNYDALRTELLSSGIISEASSSETTVTNLWWSDSGFGWKGKDPDLQDIIYRGAISYEFGRTVGWKIKEGRDFSRDYPSDSTAMILNETAVKYMGFEDPIGEQVQAYGRNYTVIGVVEDMMTQSLYQPNKQTIFVLDRFDQANFISLKINPELSASNALEELKGVFVKHNPNTPFDYTFADDEFAWKFSFEERIGKLVSTFSILAIFISCLGLFGLASFVAEQRTKEIGVRKVLGASVFSLWKMLSRDFVGLVIIAVFIATPVAYYFMSSWLQQYNYRTEIAWWIFAAAGSGALAITLCTVSYQSVRAARANPVDSLKSD
jgi:putative ABC transport system permease protein